MDKRLLDAVAACAPRDLPGFSGPDVSFRENRGAGGVTVRAEYFGTPPSGADHDFDRLALEAYRRVGLLMRVHDTYCSEQLTSFRESGGYCLRWEATITPAA